MFELGHELIRDRSALNETRFHLEANARARPFVRPIASATAWKAGIRSDYRFLMARLGPMYVFHDL